MASFECKCGFGLSNSTSPNDVVLRVYTDREWYNIMGLDIHKMDNLCEIPLPNNDVWTCPKCGRIEVRSCANGGSVEPGGVRLLTVRSDGR